MIDYSLKLKLCAMDLRITCMKLLWRVTDSSRFCLCHGDSDSVTVNLTEDGIRSFVSHLSKIQLSSFAEYFCELRQNEHQYLKTSILPRCVWALSTTCCHLDGPLFRRIGTNRESLQCTDEKDDNPSWAAQVTPRLRPSCCKRIGAATSSCPFQEFVQSGGVCPLKIHQVIFWNCWERARIFSWLLPFLPTSLARTTSLVRRFKLPYSRWACGLQ